MPGKSEQKKEWVSKRVTIYGGERVTVMEKTEENPKPLSQEEERERHKATYNNKYL